KIRMGCYWTAQRLAKAGLISKMYIERCPFCNKNAPETIEHMLIECFRWNSIRHETTIFNIPRLYRTVTIDQSTDNQALNQGRNIMVGKLLGGESKETRSLLAQSRDRYSPYMKELETGRFMNGIRVVRTLILDRIKVDYQIIDVRDNDFLGGNIPGAINIPAYEFESKSNQLAVSYAQVPMMVFHCALSQSRGPKCARIYADALKHTISKTSAEGVNQIAENLQRQEICILSGGFISWYSEYRNDTDMIENYVKSLWE
ncbi:hypothetical protein BB560_005743, partial [Smittium megazygosporum]